MINEGKNRSMETVGLSNAGADNKKTIEIYDDLLKTVWDKILPTLGIVTVMTITERAIAKTKNKFSFLKSLQVTENGINFSESMDTLALQSDANLKNAFKLLVCSLFDILAKLTGNILVNQLMREVDGIEID